MSESGSPMWLLKFPRLRTTRYRPSRNSLVTSLVVVLPALPVIATTFVPASRRIPCASACSAAVVSSTSITTACRAVGFVRARQSRGTTTPPAPASIADAAKSAPSNRSPRTPTYSEPAFTVRLSIDTSANSVAASPDTSEPSICAATQAATRRSSDAPVPASAPVPAASSPLPGVMPHPWSFRHARLGAPARKSLTRHRDVVERQRAIADDLVFLVPLARDQHDVAGTGHLDGLGDRRAPIDDRQQSLRAVPPRVRRNPAADLLDDPVRILAARVVRRDHDEVAEAPRDGAHQRTLRAIAIAAAPKDGDKAPVRQRTGGLEQVAK